MKLNTNLLRIQYLTPLAYIYFFLLFWIDIKFIVVYYEYSGFVKNYSIDKLIVSLISIFLFIMLTKVRNFTYSIFFYKYIIIILILIPSLVHFSVSANYNFYFMTTLSCFIVFYFMSVINTPSFSFISLSPKFFIRLLSFLSIIFIVSIILKGGLNYFNLNLLDVYKYRRIASSNLPGLYAYWGSINSKIILPTIIIFSLSYRMRFYTLLAIICAIIQFGLLSHKGTLFNPFVAIFLYYFLIKGKVIELVLWGMILICIISIIDFYLYPNYSSGMFSSLFARRVLMVPPLLNDFFIEFFSNNEPYYWCASKVTLGLLNCPYEVSAPFVIGKEYFGNIEMSANIGWLGAGFSNFKIVGMVIYSVLLGLILSLLAGFEKKLGYKVVISTSFLIIFNLLTSTDILTGFLTHGLFYLFLIYIFLPRRTY